MFKTSFRCVLFLSLCLQSVNVAMSSDDADKPEVVVTPEEEDVKSPSDLPVKEPVAVAVVATVQVHRRTGPLRRLAHRIAERRQHRRG